MKAPAPASTLDFLSIAKSALARGFPITVLNPKTKEPCLLRWNRNPVTTVSNAMQLALDYPHHNVGVVGRRGIGNLIIWDIDSDGVTERVVRDTERPLPHTYTVQSRPQTKPWKRHFYFRQTATSVAAFQKETNVKDVSLTEDGKHPTLYDLKGCGGGGQVVAAGGIHPDTGEVYIVAIDAPVAPIPDSLVEWLRSDIHAYHSAKQKERIAKASAKAGNTDGKGKEWNLRPCVNQEDVYALIASRAGSFASLGVGRDDIEDLLLKQVVRFCENGTELVKRENNLIRRTAHNPRLKMGSAPMFGSQSSGLSLNAPLASRHSQLVSCISSFPDKLSSDEAEQRVTTVWPDFDKTQNTHRAALYKARKAAGFAVNKKANTWVQNKRRG